MHNKVCYKNIGGKTVKITETVNGVLIEDNTGIEQSKKGAKCKEEKEEKPKE